MRNKSHIKQNDSMIGISIGLGSIKLVQVFKVKNQWHVIHTSHVEIDIHDGVNDKESIYDGLSRLLCEVPTKKNHVVCVINCPKTLVAKVQMPMMPDNELGTAIRWGSKNQFPFSLEEAILDYRVIDKFQDGEVIKQNILVGTTTQKNVDIVRGFFEEQAPNLGEFKLSAIIPTSLALESLFQNTADLVDDHFAVVEMERAITEFNVYSCQKLQFSRKLPISGNDITDALTRPLVSPKGKVELSVKEAEYIKIKYGIPDIDQSDLIEDKMTPQQLMALMRPKLELLVQELQRSIDFYREQYGYRISKVYLRGGQSLLNGLKDYLIEELEVEIEMGIPLNDVKVLPGISLDYKEEEASHRSDLALGAALYDEQNINFLVRKRNASSKSVFKELSAVVCAIAVIIGIGFIGSSLFSKVSEARKKHTYLTKEYKRIIPKMNALKKQMKLNKYLMSTPQWGKFLKGVSFHVESNIQLLNVNMKDDQVRLKGVIFENNKGDHDYVLSEFMSHLKDDVCTSVGLIESRKDVNDMKKSEFEIQCKLPS